MSTLKEDDNTLCEDHIPMEDASNLTALNIQDLPEEIFEIIVGFLPGRDLDTCFDVCKKWRRILNNDKFWKRCCKYPEKYFKLSSRQVVRSKKSKSKELCEWRKHFILQKDIWANWKRGRFNIKKCGIFSPTTIYFMDIVDDHGNHWLFDSTHDGINIWNINDTPVLHSRCSQNDHFGILPLQDKVLTSRSNYVKVFHFTHPEYELNLNYRFKFERSEVLPEHEVVPDDDYVRGVRYIVVDNQFFIGYNENITNIRSASIHIWDLNSGCKIATQSVFQQSFVNLVQSMKGSDVTNDFNGGLLLFAGDNSRFLVNLIDDRFKLCHISLFSLAEMKFVTVVAHFESRTAWCFMKGDIVVIYHILQENNSQISVYNVNGDFLGKLDFPSDYNPAFTNELWFGDSKVILKVKKKINVLTIVDQVKLCKNYFKLNKERFILKYFDPKFLLLFNKGSQYSEVTVSIWDINSGVKLWKLQKLWGIFLYQQMLNKSEYPGRLLVQFKGDREISILNFDQHQ